MKAKIVSVFLAVLLVGLVVLPGCVSKAELEECKAQVAEGATQIKDLKAQVEKQTIQITVLGKEKAELEKQKVGLEGENAELEGQNAELEEQIAELQAEIECLREPPPEKVRGEIAGYISYKETIEVKRKVFPNSCGGTAGSPRTLYYPLMSVETLKQFLADDKTNTCPSCRGTCYDAHDGWAFQLKDHWIKAGLSAWSLGLVKVEVDTQYGRILVWRNIFLTQENGEFVFYEVDPCTDEILKIEGSTENYRVAMITDKLWIIN